MFLSSTEAANELGVSARHMRRQAASGRVASRRYGNVHVIAERQLQMMQRTTHRGRPWRDTTKRAALDLLATGATTELAGSERSRLKQRLRTVGANVIAGQILPGRTTLRSASNTSNQAQHVPSIVSELGLSPRGGLGVLIATNSSLAARRARLGVDDEGNIVAIDGNERHTPVLEAIALYAYGDARENAAASAWLAAAQAAL